MIGTIIGGTRMAWAIARIAAPDTTQRLVDAVFQAPAGNKQDQHMADQMNAMANMATAFNQYRSKVEASNSPIVVEAWERLGKTMRVEQDAREELVKRKIAEAST